MHGSRYWGKKQKPTFHGAKFGDGETYHRQVNVNIKYVSPIQKNKAGKEDREVWEGLFMRKHWSRELSRGEGAFRWISGGKVF